MGLGSGRVRSAAAVVSAAAAVVLVTGCPHEADDARNVVFSIQVAYDGTFPRDPDRQRLVVGSVDAEALGVRNPTSFHDFGSFTIRTTTIAEGDEKFTYCIADPIVISDASTGELVHTLPAGTCLEERTPLTVG